MIWYWGGLGGSPSLGTLEYMLRKSPDMGISLHEGPFPPEGNLVCGEGACIPGTLIDEWRRALVVGHLSARDSMKGTLREGSFTGEPERWGLREICRMPCKWASLSVEALLGNLEGVQWDFWEKRKVYFGPRGHKDFKSGDHLEHQ